MILTHRPLVWAPRPDTYPRRHRPFKVEYRGTLMLLQREISHLDGGGLIIGGGWREHEVRRDGGIRSDAKEPAHPGVEVSFDSRFGRLVYATDVCTYWRDNVRSIALGLESLRAVDRYGVADRGQQYAGWKALPAASGFTFSLDDARLILLDAFGADHPDPDDPDFGGWTLDEMYRRAAKAVHPDTGGSEEAFLRVRAAYELLKANAA